VENFLRNKNLIFKIGRRKNQADVLEVPVGTYNYLQLSLALTADVKYERGKFVFLT
jgi:hypothetical protein